MLGAHAVMRHDRKIYSPGVLYKDGVTGNGYFSLTEWFATVCRDDIMLIATDESAGSAAITGQVGSFYVTVTKYDIKVNKGIYA